MCVCAFDKILVIESLVHVMLLGFGFRGWQGTPSFVVRL